MRLSLPDFSIPKPTLWDFIAILVATGGAVVAGMNWMAATSGGPIGAMSSSTATAFAITQLGVSIVSLVILGKTAKAGTIIGNLAAVSGVLVGVSGGLLAAALWVAA